MNIEDIKFIYQLKKEYSKELAFVLVDHIRRYFKELYDLTRFKNKVHKLILKEFQEQLRNVSLWDEKVVHTIYEKVKSKETHIESLIVPLLDLQKNKCFIQSPCIYKPDVFLHKCITEVAREIWKKPFLFYSTDDNLTFQKNEKDINQIIIYSIKKVVHQVVPLHLVKTNSQNKTKEENDEDINSDELNTLIEEYSTSARAQVTPPLPHNPTPPCNPIVIGPFNQMACNPVNISKVEQVACDPIQYEPMDFTPIECSQVKHEVCNPVTKVIVTTPTQESIEHVVSEANSSNTTPLKSEVYHHNNSKNNTAQVASQNDLVKNIKEITIDDGHNSFLHSRKIKRKVKQNVSDAESTSNRDVLKYNEVKKVTEVDMSDEDVSSVATEDIKRPFKFVDRQRYLPKTKLKKHKHRQHIVSLS